MLAAAAVGAVGGREAAALEVAVDPRGGFEVSVLGARWLVSDPPAAEWTGDGSLVLVNTTAATGTVAGLGRYTSRVPFAAAVAASPASAVVSAAAAVSFENALMSLPAPA